MRALWALRSASSRGIESTGCIAEPPSVQLEVSDEKLGWTIFDQPSPGDRMKLGKKARFASVSCRVLDRTAACAWRISGRRSRSSLGIAAGTAGGWPTCGGAFRLAVGSMTRPARIRIARFWTCSCASSWVTFALACDSSPAIRSASLVGEMPTWARFVAAS